jgi:hypothetical protein
MKKPENGNGMPVSRTFMVKIEKKASFH